MLTIEAVTSGISNYASLAYQSAQGGLTEAGRYTLWVLSQGGQSIANGTTWLFESALPAASISLSNGLSWISGYLSWLVSSIGSGIAAAASWSVNSAAPAVWSAIQATSGLIAANTPAIWTAVQVTACVGSFFAARALVNKIEDYAPIEEASSGVRIFVRLVASTLIAGLTYSLGGLIFPFAAYKSYAIGLALFAALNSETVRGFQNILTELQIKSPALPVSIGIAEEQTMASIFSEMDLKVLEKYRFIQGDEVLQLRVASERVVGFLGENQDETFDASEMMQRIEAYELPAERSITLSEWKELCNPNSDLEHACAYALWAELLHSQNIEADFSSRLSVCVSGQAWPRQISVAQ